MNKNVKMKFIYFLICIFLFNNCSFDNKTGIWNNKNIIKKADNNIFNKFEKIIQSNETFKSILPLKKNFKFNKITLVNNLEWKDIFYNKTNNYDNYKYNNTNELIFKSKKLTKYNSNYYILFEENNAITTDNKGNILVFSIDENKVIAKYNFYKKKFKKYKKYLNLIVDNNIIYISDNIGYLYAFNYKENKILWAKNYIIPFRSNLKLTKEKLIAVNQNNELIFFDKKTGDVLKKIPTEETIVKNKFVNTLSQDKESTLLLNTYGSLYSINNETMKINWFQNLNQSFDVNPGNLFSANEIINNKDKIVITTNEFIYVLDVKTGYIEQKKNISSIIKPIIIDDYLFLVTSNNLLIALDLYKGDIIYSYDINEKISNFFNIKKKQVLFKNILFANDNVFIFLQNSYILKFNINGNLEEISKLPSKINTSPIFIDGSILFLDTKNKIIIVD